ncbi:hypothetical protein PC121_g5954 [Phytophthora cactorum]|nr:hypothetical protein PC120_g16452 [Phytophthora cactorum]KAG3082853.1 hypothetical protein PC121_g5954 [Phytophthora cactorum]
MGNLPFSFCESKETRQYTKLNPISEETLTAIMEAVTNAVENAIGYEMPESFGLIIDGWTHVSAVVAGFCGGGTRRSPERREPPQSYQEVFTLFRHRLNLAVRDFLQPSESDLEEVQQLMRKLRTLNQAVKLRAKTPLRAVLRQDTRWASTFSMLKRYFRLREFISADDDEGLQVEGLTLLHGRDLFDCLIEIRPSFSKYLAPDADIVHSPEFEQAVVKVLAGEIALLNEDEAAALEPFKRASCSASVSEPPESSNEGFAARLSQGGRCTSVLHATGGPSADLQHRGAVI